MRYAFLILPAAVLLGATLGSFVRQRGLPSEPETGFCFSSHEYDLSGNVSFDGREFLLTVTNNVKRPVDAALALHVYDDLGVQLTTAQIVDGLRLTPNETLERTVPSNYVLSNDGHYTVEMRLAGVDIADNAYTSRRVIHLEVAEGAIFDESPASYYANSNANVAMPAEGASL